MISSERHEIAKRLRMLASHAPVDAELVNNLLGLYPGEYIDGYDPCNIQRLADLIEPEERTCRNVADNYYGMGFVCSECTRAVTEDEYDHEVDKYCPCCGAKVVE